MWISSGIQPKPEANLRKHGINFADAAVALEDENALSIVSEEHGELRWKTLAISPMEAVLLIVHAEQDAATVRIISARRATRPEQRQYYEEQPR